MEVKIKLGSNRSTTCQECNKPLDVGIICKECRQELDENLDEFFSELEQEED